MVSGNPSLAPLIISYGDVEMTYRNDFRHLSHFFSCYFHEDWTEEYKDEETAIASYVEDEGSSEAGYALHDLDRFMPLNLTDTEVGALIS